MAGAAWSEGTCIRSVYGQHSARRGHVWGQGRRQCTGEWRGVRGRSETQEDDTGAEGGHGQPHRGHRKADSCPGRVGHNPKNLGSRVRGEESKQGILTLHIKSCVRMSRTRPVAACDQGLRLSLGIGRTASAAAATRQTPSHSALQIPTSPPGGRVGAELPLCTAAWGRPRRPICLPADANPARIVPARGRCGIRGPYVFQLGLSGVRVRQGELAPPLLGGWSCAEALELAMATRMTA